MSKLHLICEFSSPTLRSLGLPVEIRKSNFTLVARGLSSQAIELEPGIYHVVVKLPNGQELYDQVQILEDKDTKAVLTPENTNLNASQEAQYFLRGFLEVQFQADQFESQTSKHLEVRLRTFIGNVLLYEHQITDHVIKSRIDQEGTIQLNLEGSNLGLLTQLLQSNAPAINVVLPAWVHNSCLLILMRHPNGLYSIDVHLEHLEADALLGYLQRGFLEQATVLITSPSLNFKQLLDGESNDPIAATILAYALLRLGDFEQLDEWAEKLKTKFEWLPDALAIWGEYLARMGNHEQALTLFLDLPSRGLPIFSDGLSYVIDRLRLYTSLKKSHFEQSRLSRAKNILERLQRLATFTDFRMPILTFTGIDPGNPDDTLLGENTASYGGLALTEHLTVFSQPREYELTSIRKSQWEPLTEWIFPTFFHINDYDEAGYAILPRLIAISYPLVLWAPSGQLLEKCYHDKENACSISPEQFIKLIEECHVQIIGREEWFNKNERSKHPWPGAYWLDGFDDRIQAILRERRDAPLEQQSVRIVEREDGPTWAENYLNSKPSKVLNTITQLIKEQKVPEGVRQMSLRFLEQEKEREAVKTVLRDLRNHVRAITLARAKVPFFSNNDADFFRRIEAEGTIPEIKKEMVISVEMGQAIIELVDRLTKPERVTGLEGFIGTSLHQELASWFSRATDEAHNILPKDFKQFLDERLWEHASKGRLSERLTRRLREGTPLFAPEVETDEIVTWLVREWLDPDDVLGSSGVNVGAVPAVSGLLKAAGMRISSGDQKPSYPHLSNSPSMQLTRVG